MPVTKRHIFKSGRVRGELVRYKDGIGGTVWVPFDEEDGDDGAGVCFDFSHENIDDYKKVFEEMASAADDQISVYIYDEFDEYMDKKDQERETWWYKFKWWIKDWGFQFMPFDWSFKIGGRGWYTMMDSAISIGPFKFTKGRWK